jgi:adenine-specific DNA-methyltransferase
MCKETIRRAVVEKFSPLAPEKEGFQSFEDVQAYCYHHYKKEDKAQFNALINDIKICDPAVGSGHFLVSALNELIVIKKELGVLVDKDGLQLRVDLEVVNDELIVTDEDGVLFSYNPNNKESQRIQETLFHEKQTIIENCLFGVDINPNSVKICRLRLWIELLKNSYYRPLTPEGGTASGSATVGVPPLGVRGLETLPNIDINIKCGNSLIARFGLDADLKIALKNSKWNIESYKLAVATYRNADSKEQKREMERLITDIKGNFRTEIGISDPKKVKLKRLNGELFMLTNQTGLFERSKKEQTVWNKSVTALTADIKTIELEIEEIIGNKIYENAFEWRFEFPDVLNDNGDFVGFDVVIGNPPYIKEYEGKEIFDGLRDNEVYQGKMDIWYMFTANAIKLLKIKGTLNFIAPNNWTTNSGASKMRNFMLSNAKIIQLIDFGSFMVFDSASIQTMIMQFTNQKSDNYTFDYRKIIATKPIFEDAIDLINNNKSEASEILHPNISTHHYFNKLLTFTNNVNDVILNKLKEKQNFTLNEKEVANGIHPHHDFVNKKISELLNGEFKVGEGIFGLNENEKIDLNLTSNELELIKPYYTSEQFSRYSANKKNKLWIIYTSSKFKNPDEILPYPNIKKHLDKFVDVITSDNKPYGLHRTREENFFKGEKIIVQRKCAGKPVFTYTDFDTYVSATFYVIKTENLNQKYLTGVLNSRLIEFWLKNKGKMQGNNFQLDKEPLLNIPLIKPNIEVQNNIESKVNEILLLKSQPQIASSLAMTADTQVLEQEIDAMVYELYGLSAEEIAIVEGPQS